MKKTTVVRGTHYCRLFRRQGYVPCLSALGGGGGDGGDAAAVVATALLCACCADALFISAFCCVAQTEEKQRGSRQPVAWENGCESPAFFSVVVHGVFPCLILERVTRC